MVVVRLAKYEEWLEPDKLLLLEGWAREGLLDGQIAKNMGISEATYYLYKKNHPEIKEALRKGKEVVDFEVENALYKRAIGYTIRITEEKLDKEGYVHNCERDLHIPGDVTAQIFWLKNRKRMQWRDKVEYSNDGGEINKLDELLKEIKKDATE